MSNAYVLNSLSGLRHDLPAVFQAQVQGSQVLDREQAIAIGVQHVEDQALQPSISSKYLENTFERGEPKAKRTDFRHEMMKRPL